MSIYKMIIDLQNDADVADERILELELMVSILAVALKSQPCRCQMKGGPRWHLRSVMEVETQCSKHQALALYEEFKAQGISASSKKRFLELHTSPHPAET